MKEWIKDIAINDMPNADLRLIAEHCGIEIAVKLLEELPGITLNIPKFGFKKVIEKYICKMYDGKNAKELALRLNVTERYIYLICQQDERQDELF